MSVYFYCMVTNLHRASWHSSATLTEVFPCYFPSCKANARAKPAKTGHGQQSYSENVCVILCIVCVDCVVLCIVCVCKCVLYCCHRVPTQFELTNITYIIYYHGVRCK